MARVNLLNKRVAGRAFSTNFVIAAPDYLVKKGVFRARLKSRLQALLTIYLDQLKSIALTNYSKWLKGNQTVVKVYSRATQRQEVGRFTVTNPLFSFVEWPVKAHPVPLLRAEGPVFDERKAARSRRIRRLAAGGQPKSRALKDAQVLGTSTLSKTRSPRPAKQERKYIANSGITRWTKEHGGGVPYLVARKIALTNYPGKLIITRTIQKIADVLGKEVVGAVMAVFNGYN